VKRSLLLAAAFCAALSARVGIAQMVQQPHPAVARIIAPEPDGTSYGSGSLIAVNDHYGLVITNWHVIRDATGQIWVVFPGGFQSPATIMKADRDWDLAALIVFRPNVDPLPISTQAPLLGERLTIAGYGSGWYRAVSGRCVHYFSPGGDLPAEIVELSTPARNGDSGGPIFNDRGEVAGVLFGADSTSTMGSYCGRLRRFLAPLANDFARLPPPLYPPRPNAPSPVAPQPAMIAQQNPMRQEASPSQIAAVNAPLRTPEIAAAAQPIAASNPVASNPVAFNEAVPKNPPSIASRPELRPAQVVQSSRKPISEKPNGRQIAGTVAASKPATNGPTTPTVAIRAGGKIDAQATTFDQLKNFLAVIGITALLMQGLRFLGKAAK
jgi:hypothetical protein